MITEIKGQCQYEFCDEPATCIASGRDNHPGVGKYCRWHGELVAKEDYPEYVEWCPNCDCMFGIN